MRRVLAQWASVYDDYRADAVEYLDADPWVLVQSTVASSWRRLV